ncbi:MAG: hypothetical protein AAF630_18285 [Cyanobacteria bacterium P01_C01_bin.38]
MGIGDWALGIGHRREQEGGARRQGEIITNSPMPHAPCPMPNYQLPTTNYQLPTTNYLHN